MCLCLGMHMCMQKPRKSKVVDDPGAGVTACCELPSMGPAKKISSPLQAIQLSLYSYVF